MLSAPELSRYARQLVLPEVGLEGQQRLRGASVAVVGAGGLGSPVALYLAAAGVGTIGVIDDDAVEINNLHRQILHTTADVGLGKATSAAESLGALNPHVQVKAHGLRLTPANAETILGQYDLAVDGSDNYATRYAVNDACVRLGKTWIYGSVERFSGQVSVFAARNGPCYRCIFPEPPAPGTTPSCEEIGVIGAVPGVIGSLQAVEALKCILGIGEPLSGRLLQIDFKTGETRTIRFDRRADCPACGIARPAAAPSTTPAPPLTDIEPSDLARRIDAGETLRLLDIREPWEWQLGHIGDPQFLAIGDLERGAETLDPGAELIVYCHHGLRSGLAAEWLRARGFQARNLVGGIDRWSREVDPSIRRY